MPGTNILAYFGLYIGYEENEVLRIGTLSRATCGLNSILLLSFLVLALAMVVRDRIMSTMEPTLVATILLGGPSITLKYKSTIIQTS